MFTNIDFNADEGEFVSLLGPSGCGKSTLLRCLVGLTAVDSGEITLDGQELLPLPPQQRGIGMVFQSYALFPNMTVAANVAFGLKMQKAGPDVIRQRTDGTGRVADFRPPLSALDARIRRYLRD